MSEQYTHGYASPIVQLFSSRTAEADAAFVLPHLKPGMKLLDCGCGPGSITIGLARVVEPGETTGIDIDTGQVEFARERASQTGVDNVRFETADVYELPFSDNEFDAVFMYALLEHLDRPEHALSQAHRVLKPGGIVGVSHGDFSLSVTEPPNSLLDDMRQRTVKRWERLGIDPHIGRTQQRLLREAGFVDLEIVINANTGLGERMAVNHPNMLRNHREFLVNMEILTKDEADDSTLIETYIEQAEAWLAIPDRKFVWATHWETIGRKPT